MIGTNVENRLNIVSFNRFSFTLHVLGLCTLSELNRMSDIQWDREAGIII